MRALWTGEISFGLVTIPVKLYTATKDLAPAFTQLHKECGSKISMVRRCPKCSRDISWDEIGKGYEIGKGQYALFTKEELAEIEGDDGAGGIDIAEFIDPEEVDTAFFEKSYWVGPAGKSSRGFELLRSALVDTGKAAVARVKIRTRTRLGMLRPRDGLFSLDMMRFGDEIVSNAEIDKPDAGRAPSPREKQLALDLVKQLSAPFDPKKHPDAYRNAVSAAVDQKIEQNQLATDGATDEQRENVASGGQLIDLAEMLARSLRTVGNTVDAEASPLVEEPVAEAAPESVKPGPKKAGEEAAEQPAQRRGRKKAG